MKSKKTRIAVLIETSLESGRQILNGIAKYAHKKHDWQLFHVAGDLPREIPDWISNFKGDAIIARIQNKTLLKHLNKINIPVINTLDACDTDFPLIHVDDNAISKMAAEHLIERNFENFAYVGIADENWSLARKESFKKNCKSDNFSSLEVSANNIPSTQSYRKLSNWIKKLPKPIGIMVCSDRLGLLVIEACRAADLQIPEQASIISVDNDLPLCSLSNPSLSSIDGSYMQIGMEAAKVLDKYLSGSGYPKKPVLVKPKELIQRESSAIHAVSDVTVAKAIKYIRNHYSTSINNNEVCQHAGISRTLFQQRFKNETGKTIHEFVLYVRIQKAIKLLEESDLSLKEIAFHCGFKHQEYFSYAIKSHTGETPRQIRIKSGSES